VGLTGKALEKRRRYAARLRDEGCEVEWRGAADDRQVSRVVIPHRKLSDEEQIRIFQLILDLASANCEQ
jgi:hypothetical protein